MMKYDLGLDLSTQGLKALLIDPASGAMLPAGSVNFERDLPEFGMTAGHLPSDDPALRHADPLCWLAAVDLLFGRMRDAGVPLGEIAAVAGSGQQHASVYLEAAFDTAVGRLDPSRGLAEQLAPLLTRKTAPIWMDTSTARECRMLADRFGARLADDTGSAATERFTGPQIAKFRREDPALYDRTGRIHLASSFMASVMAGAPAPVDYGDGSGMNLLNLKTGRWDRAVADAVAPGLLDRLPAVASSETVVGPLNPYFRKYGFDPACRAVVWTGDNPASLVGVGASECGCGVVSLGTSDTFFAAMARFTTDPDGCGHVFGNPGGGFMSLACFLNGSLARESFRERFGVTWPEASELIAAEPAGNRGNLLLPFVTNEITPIRPAGVRYRGSEAFVSGRAAPGVYLRALFEAQALRLKVHSAWIGAFARLRLTGGASKDKALTEIIADVFQCPVEMLATADSAALGAAMLAAHAAGGIALPELYARFCKAERVIEPRRECAAVYAEAAERYRRFDAE